MWASITDGVIYLITEFVGGIDEVLAAVGKAFVAGQGEKNASFYDLAATILGDLTGVEVDAEALKQSAFGSGRLAAMQTFGADLFNQLEDEFKPASGDLEAGDAAPAEKFLGFLMNFAIRQGNIELLTSLLPEGVRFGEGFRAYGELMAKNLGLGRLARQALKPLLQTLVADPLAYRLQEDYRPKRIGVSPAIKKFFRDSTFEQQMRKELAQEGFSDSRIEDLIADARPLLSARELFEYTYRVGAPDAGPTSGQTQALRDGLAQHGYTSDDTDRLIALSRPPLEKAEITLLFEHGTMDQQTAITYLNKLGYDSDTAQLVLRAHSVAHTQTKRLGLGELKRAFHNNVIDLLELKAHLTAQGYSDDDIQIITLDLLQPTHGKVRQLSLAEIKAGFKAGVLTEHQADQHLRTIGYSNDDIAVILKTFSPPAPPATPAAPGS